MISMSEIKKKQSVLVVDDNPKVLRFIEIDLKLRGFDVITTTSGDEAMELVKSKKPTIMMLDVIMPEMDGFEILKKLRTFSQLPVIAFSASPENRKDSLRLGADDFMNKPFRPDDMVKKIQALLGN
jgi:two-component system KDP operon response regulator KdpE